jgi:hypothetical protein
MKPIISLHAGEYLVATEIQKQINIANIWVPGKDTGIDLLVSDETNKKNVSIQVKFSKDYHFNDNSNKNKNIVCGGWWTLDYNKINGSKADFWIFVIYNFDKKNHYFIIIPIEELNQLYKSLNRKNKFQSYFNIFLTNEETKKEKTYETRDLKNEDIYNIITNNNVNYINRDVSKYLNYWEQIKDKLK